MTWKPNIVTRQAIQGFISDLFATAPEIMGIDEAISACEVILMDPYTTGALPRYIRVRIREYYQDVLWRGAPSLVVGDFCTVLHFRDGNRYEVVGASGAGGIDLAEPYLYVWVYDVSLGILVPYDTINGALAYGPLLAGDFVLIPPGTFDETITLVNGVFICEQIPGTVTITYTGAPNALSGTVVVADGGYLNVRNVHRTVDGSCNAVYAGNTFTAVCTIIVENIVTAGNTGNLVCGARMNAASGTLHLYAKTITATTTGTEGSAVRCLLGGNGTINLYVEQGYGAGTTRGYGVRCGGTGGASTFTTNVYGGVWEGLGAADAGFYCGSDGVLTALHARATGSVQDTFITGTGVINIFQVQYDTTLGPVPTHLPGDHIVLDLDTDTYITALAADDRIDLFVAGAPPTDFKFTANNVITVLDNIAQAFSVVDAGGLEYMRIVSTNANPYILFDPAGAGANVGVGNATPVGHFEVSAAVDPEIRISEGSSATSYSRIVDVGTTQMRVDKYCLIGALSIDFNPIPTDGVSAASFRFFRSVNTAGNVWCDMFLGDGTGTRNARIYGKGGDTYFCANNGNFGIGTAGPIAALLTLGGAALLILGTDSVDGADGRKLRLAAGGVGGAARGAYSDFAGNEHASAGAMDFVAGTAAGSIRFYTGAVTAKRMEIIGATGVVQIPNLAGANQAVGADAAGNLYVPHVSDRKFKDNIEPLIGGLDVVKALRGVTFDWRAEELAKVGLDFGECRQQVGLVAQEVVEVIPQAKSDGRKYKSYDRGMITPYLIEAIKEIDVRLTKLEVT